MMWEGKGEYEILPHQETWKSALKEFHINLLCFLDFDCVIVSELYDFPPHPHPPFLYSTDSLYLEESYIIHEDTWVQTSQDFFLCFSLLQALGVIAVLTKCKIRDETNNG